MIINLFMYVSILYEKLGSMRCDRDGVENRRRLLINVIFCYYNCYVNEDNDKLL